MNCLAFLLIAYAVFFACGQLLLLFLMGKKDQP